MLSQSILSDFRQTCLERNLGVHALSVFQQGSEPIQHFNWANDRYELWSGSKTFTSLAVGIAQAEGRLNLTDHVLDYFPECVATATPGSEAIRIVDLLQMRCGKDFEIFHTEDEATIAHTDGAELFFQGEQVVAPGVRFFYANAATYMLSRLVEVTSGQVLLDYLVPRLFEPLGIYNPWWNADAHGHTIGFIGLQLKVSEFAKLGRLLLQDGRWEDAQLVPAAYVQALHTDTVPPEKHFEGDEWDAGYGYQVWSNVWPGSYRADGMYGQFSIVVPDRNAVVTLLSHNEQSTAAILAAVFADLVPKL